jgi:hypothetical protein
MKNHDYDHRLRRTANSKRILFVITICIIWGLIGCMRVQSKEELIGSYELRVGKETIELEIIQNGSFIETIHFASGNIEKVSGNWDWDSKSNFISFDKLWIPTSFTPDYVLRGRALAGIGKLREPGRCSTTPEKHVGGKVVLPVFPDSNIAFTMKSQRTGHPLLCFKRRVRIDAH